MAGTKWWPSLTSLQVFTDMVRGPAPSLPSLLMVLDCHPYSWMCGNLEFGGSKLKIIITEVELDNE